MMKTRALVSSGLARAAVNAAVRSSGTFIPEGADMAVVGRGERACRVKYAEYHLPRGDDNTTSSPGHRRS